MANEDDHNYLSSESNIKTDVIYMVNSQMTSTSDVDEYQPTNIQDIKPTTTFVVYNPDFTVMDVAAIQTIQNEENHTRIS